MNAQMIKTCSVGMNSTRAIMCREFNQKFTGNSFVSFVVHSMFFISSAKLNPGSFSVDPFTEVYPKV